jgi:hypothetical protein
VSVERLKGPSLWMEHLISQHHLVDLSLFMKMDNCQVLRSTLTDIGLSKSLISNDSFEFAKRLITMDGKYRS